ncbi:hypothetical protein DBZ36_19525 [Alginatibacterium sediminis]|uniref:Excalibur calcium-binding domain-containing protein n=1 Tax=Alginatibacterium sediminis TaxID=2164068 RepID=A0A420E6D9_9ALTE|nr:hypothetical protein [Alginatibacterium sediminis]RKF13250.1 hypothetical protein DBZ36_19525 [Alginatibacterium sediminis]
MKKLLFVLLAIMVTWDLLNSQPQDLSGSVALPDHNPFMQTVNDFKVKIFGETIPERCDGRYRCLEMQTLEEAEFFHEFCPDTNFDPDNDGKLCELRF